MREEQTTALDLLLGILFRVWREMLSCGPVVWLLALGCRDAPPGEYVNAVAVLVIAVLVLNPFRLIGRIAAPVTRIALAAAVGMVLCAVRLPWLTAYGRACLTVLALMIAAAAILTAKTSLLNHSIRQSHEVDRVLAHLTHGGDFCASEAWEKYGCRETRALLHQAVGMECPEPLVCSSYKAAYLLGFLHGARELETTAARAEKAGAEVERLKRENHSLELEISFLYKQEEERFPSEREDLPDPPVLSQEQRDAALLAYLREGHSYREAAEQFGISKSGAIKAAQRAKGQS